MVDGRTALRARYISQQLLCLQQQVQECNRKEMAQLQAQESLSREHFAVLTHATVFFTHALSFFESQLLFAISPLLALGYVLMMAFEDPEAENIKRRKKTDFQLEGHSE